MKPGSITDNELDRIAALYQLQILDSPPEEDFDDIAALAAQICDTPVSTIAFEDKKRLWFKAKFGFDFIEVPREDAFCNRVPETNGVVVVADTHEGDMFTDHPMVAGPEGI